jgi:hypothetical protein
MGYLYFWGNIFTNPNYVMHHLFKSSFPTRSLYLALSLVLYCTNSWAQTNTWIGGVGNWDVPTNWSLGIVPIAAHNVIINTVADEVSIPEDYAAVAQSVALSNGVSLQIGVYLGLQSSLTINGSTGHALRIDNSSFNLTSADLIIGNLSAIGECAIFLENGGSCSSNFSNITIDKVPSPNFDAIQLTGSGTNFYNQGNLSIGLTDPIARHGIHVFNSAVFTNVYGTGDGDPSGTISINRTGQHGILVHDVDARFRNENSVYVGDVEAVGGNGLYIYGAGKFENQGPNCLLSINRITNQSGVEIVDADSRFENLEGSLTIGNTDPVRQNGIRIRLGGYMDNTNLGSIDVDQITDFDAIIVEDDASRMDNNGSIDIGASGAIKWDGIRLRAGGDFHNMELGVILIDNIIDFDGILVEDAGSEFFNEANAIINIGSVGPIKRIGVYVVNGGTFVNGINSIVNIDRITGALTGEGIGVLVSASATIMINDGNIFIGKNNPIKRFGLAVTGTTMVNNGIIEIDQITDFDALSLVSPASSGINNFGQLKIGSSGTIGRHGIYLTSGTLTNKLIGSISINETGTGINAIQTSGGTFNNEGTCRLGDIAEVDAGFGGSTALHNTGTLAFHTVNGSGIAGSSTVNSTGAAAFVDVVGATGRLVINGTLNNNTNAKIRVLDPMALLEVNGTLQNNNSVNNQGILAGTGFIFQNSSSTFTHTSGSFIRPGNSPGTLNISGTSGNFNLGAANYQVEITGTGSGQFDRLSIGNTATVTGAVLSAVVSYTPASGDQVTILDAGTPISGLFASLSLPPGWFVNYNLPASGNITLSFGAPLPIEWQSFEVKIHQQTAQLIWQTGLEVQNKGFYVERSTDAYQWRTLGFVAARQVPDAANRYTYNDIQLPGGILYYRIRQEDLDGQISYSGIRSVETGLSGSFRWGQAHPIVAGSPLRLVYDGPSATDVRLEVWSAQGVLIHHTQYTDWQPNDAQELSLMLSSGTYYLHLTAAGEQHSLITVVR